VSSVEKAGRLVVAGKPGFTTVNTKKKPIGGELGRSVTA
jgi:hypothetical protein